MPRPRLLRSDEQPEVTFETNVARVLFEQAERLHMPFAHESMFETREALDEPEAALTRLMRPPTFKQFASEDVARDVSVDWHPEEMLRSAGTRRTGSGQRKLLCESDG